MLAERLQHLRFATGRAPSHTLQKPAGLQLRAPNSNSTRLEQHFAQALRDLLT